MAHALNPPQKKRVANGLRRIGCATKTLRDHLLKELRQTPKELRARWFECFNRSIQAICEASRYRPATVVFQDYELSVHNREIAKRLKSTYSAEDLEDWMEGFQAKGVFEFETHPLTGLVSTTEMLENPEMRRQWTTDSVMVGFWQQQQDPDAWRKSLLVNAAFACSPDSVEACRQALDSPAWTRRRNEWGEIDERNGMPHIFLPDSVEWPASSPIPHPESIRLDPQWRNQKRLESQALLLFALVEQVGREFAPDAGARTNSTSVHASIESSGLMVQAISYLANFLLAANTNPRTKQLDAAGPTAGSWEERPYEQGMTWDVAITEMAFVRLRDLLYPRQVVESTHHIRKRFQSVEFGDRLLHRSRLNQMTQCARAVVRQRIVNRLRNHRPPLQARHRAADTSLTFLAAFGYRLDPDPLVNARLYLQLLSALENELSRPHGMLRYGRHQVQVGRGPKVALLDSYLGCGYWLNATLRQHLVKDIMERSSRSKDDPSPRSGDTSSLNEMVARQDWVLEGSEAQWSLGVSATLQGVARLLVELLDVESNGGGKSSRSNLAQCVKELDRKLDEYLNRNFALITGSGARGEARYKSNGHEVPTWCVMEAYEAVPMLDGWQFLPGAHPLAWGRAQLFDGLLRSIRAKRALASFTNNRME